MTDATRDNPLVELLVTLVAPAFILMKLSGPDHLGAVNALLLALALPLCWGARDLLRRRRLNLFAALGTISVVLTGGIGLLQLDTRWLAVKEAAVPGVIGLAFIASAFTRQPLIRTLVLSPALIDLERLQRGLEDRGTVRAFESRLRNATLLLGGTFFFSATMNYVLASRIVTSAAGSPAFNEELGRLTLWSYPMIAVPSMLMTLAVLYYLARAARELAGVGAAQLLNRTGDES